MTTTPTIALARRCATLCLAALTLTAAGGARAEDALLYLGGSAGQSNVKVGQIAFNQNDFGWKLTAGTRPISLLGAELSYIDFGKPSTTTFNVNSNASIKGAVAYGMIYAPLPLPLFDIYGKLGLARLQSSANAYPNGCTAPGPGCSLFNFNRTNTQAAYGAGAQVNWGAFAGRVEYEHYETTGGSPSLLSVAVIYKFL